MAKKGKRRPSKYKNKGVLEPGQREAIKAGGDGTVLPGSSGRPEDPPPSGTTTLSAYAPVLRPREPGEEPEPGRFTDVTSNAPATTHKIEDLLAEAVRRGDLAPGEIPAAFRRKAPSPGSVKGKVIVGGERTDGGEGLPAGMQPGDIIAEQQPIRYTETGTGLAGETHLPAGSKVYRADPDVVTTRPGSGMTPDIDLADPRAARRLEQAAAVVAELRGEDGDEYPGQVLDPVAEGVYLPPGFVKGEPEPPRELHLRAADVLAVHAGLTDTMRNPPAALLEHFDFFIGQELGKAKAEGGLRGIHSKWAGSFWPAKDARAWCGVLARQLGTARTYQVSAPMTRQVTDLYRAVRESGKAPWVDRDEVPWPSGFAWLDFPADFRDRWGKPVYTRAVSWDVTYLDYEDGKVPGARVISWSHPGDKDAYWTEEHAEVLKQFGGLSMGNSMVFPFGQRLFTQRYAGYPESDSVAVWLKVLWHVMSSEIAATAPAGDIARPVRKRALRSLKHGEVHVVLLRRARADGDGEPGHRRVNWTCRWPVDGFWRHARRVPGAAPHHAVPDDRREHCAACGARVSWVGTYIKGPAGLPLKQDKQLYRLAR